MYEEELLPNAEYVAPEALLYNVYDDRIPAIITLFEVLLRKQEHQSAEKNKEQRNRSKKQKTTVLTKGDILKIVMNAFGIADEKRIRKLYKIYTTKYRGKIDVNILNSPDIMELCPTKFTPFNYNGFVSDLIRPERDSMLKRASNTEQCCYFLPDNVFDNLLCIGNMALSCDEFFGKSDYVICEPLKESLTVYKSEFEKIFSQYNNYSYWKAIFSRIRCFKGISYVWALMAMLPSIDETKVRGWAESVKNVPQRPYCESEYFRSCLSGLLDLKADLSTINYDSNSEPCNANEILSGVTVSDFCASIDHIETFRFLAKHHLRAIDVYYIYILIVAATKDIQIIAWNLILENFFGQLQEFQC